ncbi:MAG: putative Ig domain-containing protein [Bacteriovoracaceae bacterium]
MKSLSFFIFLFLFALTGCVDVVKIKAQLSDSRSKSKLPEIDYSTSTGKNVVHGNSFNITPSSLLRTSSCSISPSLPAGLSLNTLTCSVTGVAVTSFNQTFLVTATNSYGSTSASLPLQSSIYAPTINFSTASGSYGSSLTIDPDVLENNGDPITACMSIPDLPAGLTIDPVTCQITGTTFVVLTNTFLITATNSEGSSSTSLSLTINPIVPTLSYVGSAGTSGTYGSPMSVTPTTLSTNGSNISNCTILPDLPAGLTINSTTCVISGLPTVDSASTLYTITASNSMGSTTATVTLSVDVACPTNFSKVNKDTNLGVNSHFCIAKYEMKCVGSSCLTYPWGAMPGPNAVATSQASGRAWTSISAADAKVACTNLGSQYDLVSNPEWMAVARQIEAKASNWSSGTVGSGTLSTGWSNAWTGGQQIVNTTDASCLYNSSFDTCGAAGTHVQKRTHTLPSGDEVWDMSGNAFEYIDWSMAAGLQSGPTTTCTTGGSIQIPLINCPALSSNDYMPANPANVTAANYNSDYGLGMNQFISGTMYGVRGGKYNNGAAAGIFTLNLRDNGGANWQIGFRCVYRPLTTISLSYESATGREGTVGTPMTITPTTFNNNGSAISSCTISPALPAGLSIDDTTCVISGTPTNDEILSNYTVTATNINGPVTATVSLSVGLTCPSNFVQVSRNTSLGVNKSFCVAKYEMKCVGSSCPTATPGTNAVATSQASSTPWLSISAINSKVACNNLGSNYDLISNPEWMTTAYEIEKRQDNWYDNTKGGSYKLLKGHTDGTPATYLAVTNTNDPYDGTSNTSAQALGSGHEQRRTFSLFNNSVIWDFSGNAAEWTDWILGGDFDSSPASCTTGASDLSTLSCGVLAAIDYKPANYNSITAANYTDANYNLGTYWGGGTGYGATERGISGIYYLDVSDAPTDIKNFVSFRCVYRPYVPTFSYSGATGTSGTYGSSMSISPTSLNNNGATITNFTVYPDLPSGLSIDTSTGVISGIPTTGATTTTYTVTATNSAGSSTQKVTFTVAPLAPTLSYAGASGLEGSSNSSMSISPTTLNANGETPTTCTSFPSLPSGLTINNSTCVISGTPTVVTATTSYTITATNSGGSTTATVNLWVCPTNFIPVNIVAANSGFTSTPFCVAKYEMKCVGAGCNAPPTQTTPGVTAVATSQTSNIPWYRPFITDARTGCSNLNAINGVSNKYALMTNAQWMAIARSIERNGNNWSSGVAGSGEINRGHTDGTYLAASTDNDPYFGTGDSSSSGWNQKRTHQLLNGQIIWDFSGNVQEWLDWDVTQAQKAYVGSDGSTVSSLREFYQLDQNVASGNVMDITLLKPFYDTLGTAEGLGSYSGGSVSGNLTTIRRGGWGIYAFVASYDDADISLSFRCTYIP